MTNGYLKQSQLAILIAGYSLLAGCGGGDESAAETTVAKATYAYNNLPICIDTNFNGSCDQSESLVSELDRMPSANANLLINSDGYFLTANGSSLLVSPFTTLIQNEILFNPFVYGNADRAKRYLQEVLGDDLGIDFNRLDHIHGPQNETELLEKSFRHALSLSGDLPYLKISAAVDKMISFRTLDITDKLTQSDLDMRTVNLNKRYFSSVNYSINALDTSKPLSINQKSGTLLALTSEDKLLQVDLHNGSFIEFSPTGENSASSSPTGFGSHHDDGLINILISQLMTQSTSTLTHAVQGKSAEQFYLIFQPTSAGDHSISNTCNTGTNDGTNGIFLTHLGNTKQPQSTTTKSSFRIDSFGGASGSEHRPTLPPLPPIKEPEMPPSDAKCINNNINGLIPMYENNQVAAVFTSGDNNHAQLQLLNSETLKPENISYPLITETPHVEISNNQNKLLLIQGNNNLAMLLNADNLAPITHVSIADIRHAKFVNDDKELIIANGSDTLQWLNTSSGTELTGSLTLDSTVREIASDPTGIFSAVLTSQKLYLIDNQKKEIITSTGYTKGSIYDVQMLTDKIVIARKGAIDTFLFSQLMGSPIKVGTQIVSKEMVFQWGVNSNNQFTPTTLANILRTNGEEENVSSQFEDVDIEWLPNNAMTASEVESVVISGYYRNERISLYKPVRN